MKTLLIFFILGPVFGCAANKVIVFDDSCDDIGVIDGRIISKCSEVKPLK